MVVFEGLKDLETVGLLEGSLELGDRGLGETVAVEIETLEKGEFVKRVGDDLSAFAGEIVEREIEILKTCSEGRIVDDLAHKTGARILNAAIRNANARERVGREKEIFEGSGSLLLEEVVTKVETLKLGTALKGP